MGARFSSCAAKAQKAAPDTAAQPPRPCCCTTATCAAAPPAAAATAACRLTITPTADGQNVKISIRAIPAPLKTLQEDNCLVKVQLQESFSPANPIHLILLPTDKAAQGELSHQVAEWMGTPRKEEQEAAAARQELAQAQRPRSPTGRLAVKLSPAHPQQAAQ
ncbi:hypothetical protein C2E21_8403 [Chlorella sorokiniana]|uniref:Uncharacterized protein n=1 Tax=Chlorella sorokiniana TaxID=3076 RepID=A0A2P6TEM7_CHLSO|nr:hypothetical protein C2E21_8403 [Chlorella sorokiniana]|eukprot:PRW21093.1 hypothetical protein C2E21_8403 [Chlorella sorokiniana]